ncbi:lysoplasmalogenase [Rhodococcus chondri]|uniref:Lysoplasmalogenase n=1 Tax=Rhodococcus chondri TaxID=3065941 RepID=A0ABU7JSK1_9NOCA|nr:lysoplasmalogenase [Rhodococcus sp. CC-R104]MEE2033003.1 lysoplasmalogenase [Rhodococcus sp. CC-R104]
MRRGVAARAAFTVFGVIAAVHLLAQLVAADSLVGEVSQWLLMPALALGLLASTTSPRPRLVRLTLLALLFSWLGDAAPDLFTGDTAFLVLVGFFLCAQLTYIVAFLPYRHHSVRQTRRWVLAVAGAAVVALVVACTPGAGVLVVPVAIYGLCLAAMAVLATGVDRAAAVGAVLFVISDALIALRAFVEGFALPASGFWVMSTYIAAQALLVLGVLTAVARPPVMRHRGSVPPR